MTDYLDIEQASKRIGKSTRTIRRWCHSQSIPFRMDHGKYYFDVVDLDARKAEDVDPLDNASLLERIETLENALQSIIERLDKRDAQTPITAAPAVPTKPPALRPTRLVHNGKGDTLPPDLISFRAMAKLHNIAESTVRRTIESGRLPVQRGHWKVGRAWFEMALDAAGRQCFYELFVSNPGFKTCNECPHDA